jgi:hypothetical protein
MRWGFRLYIGPARSFTLCFVSKRIICRYYILEQPGLQKEILHGGTRLLWGTGDRLRTLYFDFIFIFWGYFQLFLAYFYWYVIWTFCCTGNKSFMKVTSGFIGPQILNFARGLSLSLGPCIPLIGPIPGLVVTGAGPPHLPPPPFAIWYIISSVVNLLTRSFTLCFISKRIICRYYILEQGLQKGKCGGPAPVTTRPGIGPINGIHNVWAVMWWRETLHHFQ